MSVQPTIRLVPRYWPSLQALNCKVNWNIRYTANQCLLVHTVSLSYSPWLTHFMKPEKKYTQHPNCIQKDPLQRNKFLLFSQLLRILWSDFTYFIILCAFCRFHWTVHNYKLWLFSVFWQKLGNSLGKHPRSKLNSLVFQVQYNSYLWNPGSEKQVIIIFSCFPHFLHKEPSTAKN